MTVLENIIIPVVLTVCSETVFFSLFGFRDKKSIFSLMFINAFTNLALNIPLYLCKATELSYYSWLLLGLEILVVIIEAVFLMYMDRKNKRYQIIPLTVASNCLSFLLGLVYYTIIR